MNDRILKKYIPCTPPGWSCQRIADLLDIVDEPISMSDDEIYDLVSIRRRYGGLFFRESLRGRDILTKTLRRVVPGSFMIARMQVVHGAISYVSQNFSGTCVSKSYSQFAGREGCDTRYFSILAQHPMLTEYFLDASHGVVIEKMTFDQSRWLGFNVTLPPIGEQCLIVDIVEAIDCQIVEVERQIGKLRKIRLGALEELLGSKPINSSVREALVGSPANGIYKPANMIGRGSLLVGQTAITRDRLVNSKLARRAIVSRAELERFGLRTGDILVSRVFATVEGVGQPAMITSLDEQAVFESNMMRLRGDTSQIDPAFLFLSLQTTRARRYMARNVNLSNQASISQGALSSLPLWLPRITTQRQVVASIDAVDELRRVKERKLAKLRAQRLGLMSDLLTGRVRVPIGAAS
jgi:type I restriction enzyme S subunit